MARKEKYTQQQMIDALKRAKGMTTVAAYNLGCDWKTVKRYIDKYNAVQSALDETKEGLGDKIESTLLAMALGERDNNGGWKIEPNISALIFIAKTHPAMRERGYGEILKHEHTGKDGKPIEVAVKGYVSISPDDWDDDDSGTA